MSLLSVNHNRATNNALFLVTEDCISLYQVTHRIHGLMSLLAGCSILILAIQFAECIKISDRSILYLFIHGYLLVIYGVFLIKNPFADRMVVGPERWLVHFVIAACSLFGLIINIGDALALTDCTWPPLLFLIMRCFLWLHGLVGSQMSHR